MPIYEYACEKCGKLNEVMQKVSDPAPAACDGCGQQGPLTRVVSRTSFVLKGGGWYSDLYGSSKKGASSSKGGEAKTSESKSTESKSSEIKSSEAKPASAPASSTTAKSEK